MMGKRRKQQQQTQGIKVCIYCRSFFDNVTVCHSGEHIFPKAFGCPDSFQIYCVCKDCNQSFKLREEVFARDSPTGILRYKVKAPSKDQKNGLRHSTITLPYHLRYGMLSGAHLRPHPERPGVTFAAQIGIPISEEYYRFFTWTMLVGESAKQRKLREIARGEFRGKIIATTGLEPPTEPACLGVWQNVVWGKGCPRSVHSMLSRITLLGVLPVYSRTLSNPGGDPVYGDIETTIAGELTEDMRRTIAKIAFNYTAHVIGHEAILNAVYDKARLYITEGKGEIPLFYQSGGPTITDTSGTELYRNIIKIEANEDGVTVLVSLCAAGSFFVKLHNRPSLHFATGVVHIPGEPKLLPLQKSTLREYGITRPSS